MPPNRLQDRFQFAQALHQQGRLADAAVIYQDILRQNPRHADSLHFLGLIALQTRKTAQGVRLIEQAVALKPSYPEALGNLGIGYSDLGRHKDALASYDKALKLRLGLADVHDNRGVTLRDLGRFADAVASHDKAIALRPNDAGAHSNRGNALRDLKRYEDALASYDRAIALQPGFIEARCNRAMVLLAMHRYDEALACIDQAIVLAPGSAEAQYGRGRVMQDLKRPEDALACFAKAIALKPDYADAHNNHGNALRDLRRDQEALASFAKAVALKPDFAGAHFNIGNTLTGLRREGEALVHYDRAIAAQPDYAEAHHARGLALSAIKRYTDALYSYDRALALEPGKAWLPGDMIAARRQICDWTADQIHLETIEQRIWQGHKAVAPFILMGLSGAPALHRKAAAIFLETMVPPNDELPPLAGYGGHAKIRIGYFSADFREHAMMRVMINLFACHDRSAFELTAFSFGPNTGDAMRKRVETVFDHFIDVTTLTDRDVALLARSREIDIAIDLMGFTLSCRVGIFRYRAAPVQAVYLGFPGTMAASYIDYIIADSILIPPGSEQYYSEKVVRLPDSYQVNDRNQPIATGPVSRAVHGLPERGFVFCCFNNTYKLNPAMFDIWMRILHRVEDSVLWLYQENAEAATNLRREATARGIAPDRLVFAQLLPMTEHLDRQRAADLFLDTLPYNGHATASAALWAGLPVLTALGGSFAGRVGASLLHAIGLPDMVAPTLAGYEDRAVELATHPDRLRAIKARLEANRLATPLFDTVRFTRHLEAAFTTMHARIQAGLPPADIQVEALRDRETVRR